MSRHFGDMLLERRRQMGASIQQVSNIVKIRPQIIEYFETENFAAMPPRGYAQGMISSYARYLGLNPVSYTHLDVYKRQVLGSEVDSALMGDAERVLLEATDAARANVDVARSAKDFTAVIAALAALREPIDAFFDEVMVMDEDEALRANRLRLLNRFESVFAGIANIGEMARK